MPNWSLTTAGAADVGPYTGAFSGPTNIKSDPVHVKICCSTVLNQKSPAAKPAPTPIVEEKPALVVEEQPMKQEAPKAEEKTTGTPVSEARGLTDAERVEQALALVTPLSGYDSYAKVEKHLNRLSDEVSIATVPACTEREETEEEALAREAREMSAGYR